MLTGPRQVSALCWLAREGGTEIPGVGRQPLELVLSGRSLLYAWLSPLDRYSGPAKLDDSCGDASDDTPRSKSGARRTTVIVALIGEDERPVLWQKLLTEASLADYQAKVERLIAASQRGPGMTFLSFCCPLGTEINQSFCL